MFAFAAAEAGALDGAVLAGAVEAAVLGADDGAGVPPVEQALISTSNVNPSPSTRGVRMGISSSNLPRGAASPAYITSGLAGRRLPAPNWHRPVPEPQSREPRCRVRRPPRPARTIRRAAPGGGRAGSGDAGPRQG